MIPKPNKGPKSPSYHPLISIFNILSKVFKRLLLTRLPTIIVSLIFPKQFSSRLHYNTTLQLVNVLDKIISAKNLRKETVVVLLHVQKLFDQVWKIGVIFKLIYLRVLTKLVLKFFLLNRKLSTKSENRFSSNRNISSGVLLVSHLSLQLFAIFVNYLLLHPKKMWHSSPTTLFSISSISQISPQLLTSKNKSI